MLTPDDLFNTSLELSEIYSRVEHSCIEGIVKALVSGGDIKSIDVWRLKKLEEAGLLKKSLFNKVKEQTGLAYNDLDKVLTAKLKKSANYDSAILKGLKDSTKVTEANLLQIRKKLLAGVKNTINITNTKALQGSYRLYVKAINEAYASVGTGLYSPAEAIKKAVKDIGNSGIRIVTGKDKVKDKELVNNRGELMTTYRDGDKVRVYPLDSAIRRDIISQLNTSAANLTLADCEELGCGLVETSWHNGARPEHEVWQGKIFSLDPKNTKYGYFYGPLEQGLPAYGDPLGICGINCYHSFSPYIEGQPRASQKSKPNAEENEKAYAEQQQQRAYERRLRGLKRQQVAQKAAGYTDDAKETQRLINATSSDYRAFLDKTGRVRVSALEQVEGYKRISTK